MENTLPPALLIVFKVVLFKIYFGSLQSADKDVAPIASAHPNCGHKIHSPRHASSATKLSNKV